MNDDQIDALLADLRTDVPEMSDEAFEAGRTLLRVKASSEPVTTTLERDVTVVPLPKRRLLRSPPRKLVVPVAAAAAAMALAAGVLVVQTARHDRAAAPTGYAAVQLNAIADKIPLPPAAKVIPPGQYRYIVTHRWEHHVASTERPNTDGKWPTEDIKYLVEIVEEQWVPVDPARGCTTRVTTTGTLRWLVGSADKALNAGLELPRRESHDDPRPCYDDSLGWMAPSQELLASLPRDPVQLNDRLRNDERTRLTIDPDLTLVGNAASLLESGLVPADLRVALYRTIAMTPGLEITEQVDNLDGNKGTVFSVTRKSSRQEVIIDPTTGQFIGARWVHSDPPQKDLVIDYVAPSDPVIVDRVGETG